MCCKKCEDFAGGTTLGQSIPMHHIYLRSYRRGRLGGLQQSGCNPSAMLLSFFSILVEQGASALMQGAEGMAVHGETQ